MGTLRTKRTEVQESGPGGTATIINVSKLPKKCRMGGFMCRDGGRAGGMDWTGLPVSAVVLMSWYLNRSE